MILRSAWVVVMDVYRHHRTGLWRRCRGLPEVQYALGATFLLDVISTLVAWPDNGDRRRHTVIAFVHSGRHERARTGACASIFGAWESALPGASAAKVIQKLLEQGRTRRYVWQITGWEADDADLQPVLRTPGQVDM